MHKVSIKGRKSEPDKVTAPVPEPNGWTDIVDKAKVLKDFWPFALSGIYGTGFVVWSLYALDHHIGLETISQFQYVAAGIWIALMWAGLVLAFKLGLTFAYSKRKSMRFKAITLLVLLVCLLAFGLFVEPHLKSAETVNAIVVVVCGSTIAWMVGLSTVFGDKGEAQERSFAEHVYAMIRDKHAHAMYVVLFVGFLIACETFEGHIPTALGGFAPRTAIIAVKRLDLTSAERTAMLYPGDQQEPLDPSKDLNPVVSTKPLKVIVDTGDSVEVKLNDRQTAPIYELKRSNIVSITWLSN